MPKVIRDYKAIAKSRIIDAAAEVFYYQGLDKANMDEIARKVGITKGTIYLYFRNREDLLIETCKITQSLLEEKLLNINIDNHQEWINRFVEEELSLPDHIKFFWIKALSQIDENEKIKQILINEHTRYIEVIKNFLTDYLKEESKVNDIYVETMSEIVVSLHNGILVSILQGLTVDQAKLILVEGIKYILKGV